MRSDAQKELAQKVRNRFLLDFKLQAKDILDVVLYRDDIVCLQRRFFQDTKEVKQEGVPFKHVQVLGLEDGCVLEDRKEYNPSLGAFHAIYTLEAALLHKYIRSNIKNSCENCLYLSPKF